jgi:ring-1,2-phenylacetyl-CoA epoxidase subunit PaaC
MNTPLIDYTLSLADSTLILAQRNGEWCGHGPVLEQDIAITNITLDLVGQARSLYQYAATLKADGSTEDSLAYLRTEREFKNCLLVEQARGDWAQTVLRQFLFSNYQYYLYSFLQEQPDTTLAAIAAKSLKEVSYHLRWSAEWVVRLGDGTEESRRRMLQAIDALWQYTGELFQPASYESAMNINLDAIYQAWSAKTVAVFADAGLPVANDVFMQTGGKSGIHTEQLGYILSDLQYLQRAYPGSEW